MELSLPTVNSTHYQLMRGRYDCGGGSYGLNVKIWNGVPYLIVFISDSDKYEDQSHDNTLLYEFENQEYCGSGRKRRLRKYPKPLSQFGPTGRNRTVIDALNWNGGNIPCITIRKEGNNRWAELYADCICRGVSVASDGSHYFRIERSRVPFWLLGENENEEE